MSDITVMLNTTGDPAVTCEPKQFSANNGNQQIKWTPGGSQSFTFTSLTGLSSTPFSGLSVTAREITVNDNDQGPGDYPYTIWVMANGTSYSTQKTGPGAGVGDPTVKNK